MNVVYSLSAYPFGKLSDHASRRKLLLVLTRPPKRPEDGPTVALAPVPPLSGGQG